MFGIADVKLLGLLVPPMPPKMELVDTAADDDILVPKKLFPVAVLLGVVSPPKVDAPEVAAAALPKIDEPPSVLPNIEVEFVLLKMLLKAGAIGAAVVGEPKLKAAVEPSISE
jgi:hypothetical protein